MTSPFVSSAVAAISMAVNPAAAPNQEPQDPPPPPGVPLNYFNPQMSIVFDIQGRIARPDAEERRVTLSELEFGFAADVDPFLKAETYVAIHGIGGGHGHEGVKAESEVEVEVEEAFGRYTNLGQGLEGKFGLMRAAVGRTQRNHRDQLNFIDYPLVIQEYLGPESYRGAGASFSYLLPTERFHEVTLELLDGEGPLFEHTRLDRPVIVGRYRTFFDFSDDLTAQFGASYMNGPQEATRSQLFGVDMAMKVQPPGVGREFVLESEAYWARPGEGDGTSFGMFAALTTEIAPRWFGTIKGDYVELLHEHKDGKKKADEILRAWSLGLTYKLTEFEHWRLEWQRISSNGDSGQNFLTLQFQFLIGAHPAHRY